jgi:hypothetical protein
MDITTGVEGASRETSRDVEEFPENRPDLEKRPPVALFGRSGMRENISQSPESEMEYPGVPTHG